MQHVPPVGSTLLDRYYVEEVLDVSGDTAILKCIDTRLDVHDAVKLLIGDDEADSWGGKRQRFIQSFRAVARLNHPNIVHVANIETRCGLTFSVMELLQGPTLATFLGEGANFEAKEAIELFLGVIDAIAMAHSLDTLHKRISPSQIVLNYQGSRLSPRLLNFMSSKRTSDLDVETALPFLAPEQYRDFDNATQASDIFALCATMYHVFAHEPPLRLSSIDEFATFYEQCSGIDWFPASIPPEFVPILSAGLRARPEERRWNAISLLKEVKKIGANFKLSANLSIDASRRNLDDHPSLSSISSVVYHTGTTGTQTAQRSSQLTAISNSQPVTHSSTGSVSHPILHTASGSVSLPILHTASGSVSHPIPHTASGSVSHPIVRSDSVPTALSESAPRPAAQDAATSIAQAVPQNSLESIAIPLHNPAPMATSLQDVDATSMSAQALPELNSPPTPLKPSLAPPPSQIKLPTVRNAEEKASASEMPSTQNGAKSSGEYASESPTMRSAQPHSSSTLSISKLKSPHHISRQTTPAELRHDDVALPGELAEIYRIRQIIRQTEHGFVACVSTLSNSNELYCLKCRYTRSAIEKAVFNEGVRRSDLLAQKSPYFQGIFQSYPDETAFLTDNVISQPLPESIAQNGSYTPDVVSQIGILIAEAMDVAHQSGYINGNIKPSNIVFENRSGVMTPVIYDFGQSLYIDSLTQLQPSDVAYIAPELQYNLQQSNAQSDIFAFGMCLVYMLLGRLPYDGMDDDKMTSDKAAKIVAQYADLPALTQIAPNIPDDLSQVVHWCTAFDIANRYVRFCDVARDLRVVYQRLAAT